MKHKSVCSLKSVVEAALRSLSQSQNRGLAHVVTAKNLPLYSNRGAVVLRIEDCKKLRLSQSFQVLNRLIFSKMLTLPKVNCATARLNKRLRFDPTSELTAKESLTRRAQVVKEKAQQRASLAASSTSTDLLKRTKIQKSLPSTSSPLNNWTQSSKTWVQSWLMTKMESHKSCMKFFQCRLHNLSTVSEWSTSKSLHRSSHSLRIGSLSQNLSSSKLTLQLSLTALKDWACTPQMASSSTMELLSRAILSLIGTPSSSTLRKSSRSSCETVSTPSWSSSAKMCFVTKSTKKGSTSKSYSTRTKSHQERSSRSKSRSIGGSKFRSKRLRRLRLTSRRSGRRLSKWLKTLRRMLTRWKTRWILDLCIKVIAVVFLPTVQVQTNQTQLVLGINLTISTHRAVNLWAVTATMCEAVQPTV